MAINICKYGKNSDIIDFTNDVIKPAISELNDMMMTMTKRTMMTRAMITRTTMMTTMTMTMMVIQRPRLILQVQIHKP